jgi:hypothetical protein
MNIYIFFASNVLACAIYKDLLADFTFIRGRQFEMVNDPVRYQKLSYLIQRRIIFKYRDDNLIPHLPQIRLAILNCLKLPILGEQLSHLLRIMGENSQGVVNDLPPHIPLKTHIFIPEVIKILISENIRREFLHHLRSHNAGDPLAEQLIDKIVLKRFEGDELKLILFKEVLNACWDFNHVHPLLPPEVSHLLSVKVPEGEKYPPVLSVFGWIGLFSHSFFQAHEAIYSFRFGFNQATFIFFFYYLNFIQKLSCLCDEISDTDVSTINVVIINFVSQYLKFSQGFHLHQIKIATATFTGWLCDRDSQTFLFPPFDKQPKEASCFRLCQISLYFINLNPENNNSKIKNFLRYYIKNGRELVVFTTNPIHGKAKFDRMIKLINSKSCNITKLFNSKYSRGD